MILHLDLDSFFVSAERTKDRTLLNKKVIVGGRSDRFIFEQKGYKKAMTANRGAFVPSLFFSKDGFKGRSYFLDGDRIRGIVITASYEARAYGIKTGMSIKEAVSLCPNLIVLPPNHILYHTLSFRLNHLLKRYMPIVEQYSIDEFFADLSGFIEDDKVIFFAYQIKKIVKDRLNLPISIGIAQTKWIAKLATSFAKPEGIKMVDQDKIYDFIKDIPIEKFPGIGKSWAKRLQSYKKGTLGDIYNSKTFFYSQGRESKELYDRISGSDRDKVIPKKERKSIGISRTFDPVGDRNEIKRRLHILIRHISFILNRSGYRASTIFLSIKYEFKEKSKKHKTYNRIFTESFLKREFIKLFEEIDIYKSSKIIRLSLSLTNFNNIKNSTYSLLHIRSDRTEKKLYENIDKLRRRYGVDIVKHAIEMV